MPRLGSKKLCQCRRGFVTPWSRCTRCGKKRDGYIRPRGHFWKKLLNKKVRKGGTHKRMNWFEWLT